MKKSMVILLAALMAFLAFAAAADGKVTARGETQVRAEADGLSEIILTVADGTEMTLLADLGDWVQVGVQGVTGYVHASSVNGLPEKETPEAPQMKVTIFTSRRAVMTPGETVTLTSLLEGFEGYTVTYQWQCDKGSGFADVPGAVEAAYEFTADIESLSWDWMLIVTAYPI